jgi:signal transduction histidine kinase
MNNNYTFLIVAVLSVIAFTIVLNLIDKAIDKMQAKALQKRKEIEDKKKTMEDSHRGGSKPVVRIKGSKAVKK